MAPQPTHTLAVKPEHLAVIKNALVGVNKEGTSAARFAGAPYVSGGKTGTAQVFSLKGEKYVARKIDERLRDHAWFIAYAPADKPRIALAVLVENGGFGAQAAAPIARQVFDYYLLGETRAGPAPRRAAGADARGRERLMRCVELLGARLGSPRRGRVDSFLFGVALAIVGVGLVTLFSAADQSVARVTSQVASLGVRAGADVDRRQHPAADARARGGAALRRWRVVLLDRRRAVRRRRQRLAALAQPRLRAHPALRAHEDRAAADARVVLPEVRGPHRLEGLRGRGGADRRARRT